MVEQKVKKRRKKTTKKSNINVKEAVDKLVMEKKLLGYFHFNFALKMNSRIFMRWLRIF